MNKNRPFQGYVASSSSSVKNVDFHASSGTARKPKLEPSLAKSGMTTPQLSGSHAVTSPDSAKDTEMYNRFLALGMPSEISLEDFKRILSHSGPTPSNIKRPTKYTKETRDDDAVISTSTNEIRDALEFISIHVVGRDEARRLRRYISKAREEHKASHPTSRIKAPSTHATKIVDILDDPLTTAIARRDMAYRNLESTRNEYTMEAEKCSTLDSQKRGLFDDLNAKRRQEFLLRVLEKRENVRLKRLGLLGSGNQKGMGTLVNALRRESSLAMQGLRTLVLEGSKLESNTSLSTIGLLMPSGRKEVKHKHTTEALANLHAWHLRHVRRESANHKEKAEHAGIEPESRNRASGTTATSHGEGDVMARLESVLRRLGVQDEKGLEKMRKTLVSVASRRAASRQRRMLADMDKGRALMINERRLSEMQAENEEKKREVQTKINRAVALGWVCEGYTDLISTFRSDTAPTLHTALETEKKRIEGYIDVIRESILVTSPRTETSFIREAQAALKTTRVGISDEVRELLEKVARSEKMVGAPVGVVTGGDELPEIRVEVERNEKLLKRKAAKMEYGFEIAEEVREVLGCVRKLK